MADFHQQDLADSRFEQVHLQRARFHQVHLNEADFDDVDLTGARFREAWFKDVVMRGVGFLNTRIDGEIEGLTVNGVDVAPLVQAELERREPDLAKMRPTDPDGVRAAWDILERLWAGTVGRARELPAAALHESVDGEWSFIETLRHLVFATDAWIRRALLGDPSPWSPLDLPHEDMGERPGVPNDTQARPSLEEVLELRRDRMASMRRLVDELTDERLAEQTTVVEEPGYPNSAAFPVADVVSTILNEEWMHRQYAERDLAVLEAEAEAGADA